MNRIVLAILALFAGLAAQVSPAEARVRGTTEIGAVQGQRAAVRVAAAVQVAAAFRPGQGFIPLRDSGAEQLPAQFAPTVVAVRIGSDRAHK